jgi:putative DNA primase/helicase
LRTARRDNWEPLVAVADLAGGDWPSRARKAAVLLCAEDVDADLEASLGLRLLADIRDVFAGLTVSFLSSADLTARLRQASEAP